MKSWRSIVFVLCGLLMLAPAARADVLWNQSDYNLAESGFVNSDESGSSGLFPWQTYTTSVNDVSATDTWVISRITSYYMANDVNADPNWGSNVASGRLIIYNKLGSIPQYPANVGDGVVVPMTSTLVGDHYEVVASGLNVTLAPGEYWIGITPNAGWSNGLEANPQLRSSTLIGNASATRDFSFIFPVWYNPRPGVDAAMKIEGAVPHAPVISVNPAAPHFTMVSNATGSFQLSVANMAALPARSLAWSMGAFTSSWLSVSPMSGTTAQAAYDILTLTVDTTGLSVGNYTCPLTLQSNDATQPSLMVSVALTVAPDCNANGIPDGTDIHDGTSSDFDHNGVPDECEDCNHNGFPDHLELIEGMTPDCNGDGIPDDCNIAAGMPDANGNGIPDVCETSAVTGLHVVDYRLREPVPNPLNPSTRIGFDLPRATAVRLCIYDMTGRCVRTLVQDVLDAGVHEVMWHGVDDAGQRVSSGVYLCRLVAGSYVETRRMTLLK